VTDQLAVEAFRSKVESIVHDVGYDANGMGAVANPDVVAGAVVDTLTDAHYEYHTNEAGVAMRRVVVATEWEVDPTPRLTGRPTSMGTVYTERETDRAR